MEVVSGASERKTAVSRIAVGIARLRNRLARTSRKMFVLGGVVLILLIVGIVLLVHKPAKKVVQAQTPVSVQAARQEAGKFKDNKSYIFTELNQAVELSRLKHCPEAREIYQDAAAHNTSWPSSYLSRTKQTIEDTCSGKVPTGPLDSDG